MRDSDKTIAQIFWRRVARNGGRPLFILHRDGDFPPYTHRGKRRTMSWDAVAERVRNLGTVTIAFARGLETVARDFGHVRPHYCRTAPRLLEKIFAAAWSKPEALLGLTARGLEEGLAVSRTATVEAAHRGGVLDDAALRRHRKMETEHYREFRRLALGGNLRFFVSGGAPLSREIGEFFWCLGVPVYELYGMTETGGITTNRPGHVRTGSVGKPWPGDGWPGGGTEVRLTAAGEVAVRGPNVMSGYYNQPEATAAAVRDGWMHSGDVAAVDADGFLTITDRMKDIIITAGGKNVAPLKIEALLAEDPLISQAMVYGDRKKYLTALVTLDPAELKARARSLGIGGTAGELAGHPLVRLEVEKVIRKKNEKLARYETIKNFAVLDREFSIENEELTPTLKVRRRKIVRRHVDLLEALYRDA